jgi:hypothetical protein
MHGQPFTLVNVIDESVIGWGIEITETDHRKAVVVFYEPETRQFSFGFHNSAESAWHCWARDEPLKLVWPS